MSRRPLPGTFWRLWTASAVSNLGDGMFVIALPLLATRLTDDPISIGLIAAFFTIPWLLFALPVGALIDRSDRRRVMVTADLCRGALVGGLALVAAFSDVQVWMLWVLAFGLGLGEVFFDSGSQTILPALVPGEQLERANGYLYATEVAANTYLGMPLGSVLFAAVVWLPFGVDAVSFVVAALLAASVRGSYRPATADPRPRSLAGEVRSGLDWLLHHPLLRALALAVTLMNLAFAATQATFVLFATRQLHISDRSFGPLLAIIGTGSLLAGITGGRIIQAAGRRSTMLAAALAPALTSASIALWPTTWLVIAMTTVQAFATTLWSILAVSLRQQVVPDELFGRVNSIYRWLSTGAMPLGALLGGVLASAYGLRAPYVAAAGLLALASVAIAVTLTTDALSSSTRAAGIAAMITNDTTNGTLGTDDTPVSLERDPLDELL